MREKDGGPAFPETRWDDKTRQEVQWCGMPIAANRRRARCECVAKLDGGGMSDTHRTVARWTTADIRPAEHGGFVTYGDYLTLERQNAELLAALKDLPIFIVDNLDRQSHSLPRDGVIALLQRVNEAIRRAEG